MHPKTFCQEEQTTVSNRGASPIAVHTVHRSGLVSAIALVWFLCQASFSFGQTISFSPSVNYPTGSSPQAVAIGDLNQDGKPDLAVVNAGNDTVSVLLGAGSGSFGTATDFPVGSVPVSVAIWDLNGDGMADLAVANASGNSVSVLLNAGGGTFGPTTDVPVGVGPYSVAIGDLNLDGKPDLAVANFFFNTVSILLGDGAGSFGAPAAFPAGNGSETVAIGDLNLDGKPDLAVANFYDNTVSILLGDGTGSFGAATAFAVGSGATFVAIGDLNLDGKPDLAVANAYTSDVSILLGDGSGSVGAARRLPVGAGPQTIEIGDFNGDGKPDLAVAYTLRNMVSTLLGDGTGLFAAPADFAGGSGSSYFDLLAIGDLNLDGKVDLAVVNSGSDTVSILLNTTSMPSLPDLQMLTLTAAISGADIVTTDAVQNIGNQAAGSFLVSFYFSLDTFSPASGTLIGKRSLIRLAANGAYDQASMMYRIPDNTPKGTYYVCAIADSGGVINERNETNNARCTTERYTIGPDLTVALVSASIGGASISVSDTEQNIGNRWAEPFAVSFYFASDPTTPTSGTLIGMRKLIGLEGAVKSNAATTKLAIPDTTPQGAYYVCAVTDSGGTVDELKEANNTRCTPDTYVIGPDLIVAALSATKSGGTMSVSDTEQNIGNRRSEGFTVSFYLSLDSVFGANDTVLGKRTVVSIAGGGASNAKTTSFAIPRGLSSGNYYVIAIADSANGVIEIDETNNFRVTTGAYPVP